MFEEALERADQLDKEFAATGRLRGRLHGIPISLKDQINVEGFDSTIGFTKCVHMNALHTKLPLHGPKC
jgi:amidase